MNLSDLDWSHDPGVTTVHPARAYSQPIRKPAQSWTYRPMMMLGRGSFGIVYSSFGPHGEEVAVKKVKVDPSGSSRELSILELLRSPFCLSLIDYFYLPGVTADEKLLCLVTEKMPESLRRLIHTAHEMHRTLPGILIKLFSYQLLAGLSHIHSLGIAHRDIKTDNCLVDPPAGRLKIIDFGSAKRLRSGGPSASYIASRIYRAPELLLNTTHYDTKIDIWAAGCVISEILLDAIPMFQGSSNEDQLVQIMRILGPPTAEDEASFEHPLPFPKVEKICSIELALPLSIDPELLELLKSIFVYNPHKRPNADQLMRSPYFNELFQTGVKLPNGAPLPELPRPS